MRRERYYEVPCGQRKLRQHYYYLPFSSVSCSLHHLVDHVALSTRGGDEEGRGVSLLACHALGAGGGARASRRGIVSGMPARMVKSVSSPLLR